MDPFTILNAAGNIAQFFEYARDVYVQIGEIRSSSAGITRRNTEIIWSATELSGMVDNIASDLGSFDKAATTTEKRIREIGQKCQTLAIDLRRDIERKGMKDRAHMLTAIKSVAFKSWKPDELGAKLGELDRLQDLLFKNMIIHIRLVRSTELYDLRTDISSNQQNSLQTTMTRLAEQNRRLGVTREDDIGHLHGDVLAAVPSFESLQSNLCSPGDDTSFGDIKKTFESWTDRASSFKKEQAIISSLYFDNMSHRRSTILDPHAETFNWIYDQRLHFGDWLKADEGMYWITGDAGSGKSTLMKFLSEDKMLDAQLAKWAGSKTLVKASFYFWFSGSTLQRSQEGLLRSLLFEIFRQCPSVIRCACQERWDQDIARPWHRQELMETVKRLDLQTPNTKFCVFIDGLDEYHEQGGSGRHDDAGSAAHVSEIIEVMNVLSKLANVKICLSSRPWHAFEEAYGACEARKLYVNEENRGDIQLYVRDKFEKSEAFLRAQNGQDSANFTRLVNEIVDESRGVFLWVSLVVESLLRGLSNKDRIGELRQRLAETPKTLNGMFERMLASMEERYHEQAAQILQVALYADEPLGLFTYSYIGGKVGSAMGQSARAWTEEECVELARVTETRIKVRCPDLVKVNDYMVEGNTFTEHGSKLSVEFLHRTVGDFLALEETQEQLRKRLKKSFEPGRFICEALLAQIKGSESVYSPNWDADGEYGNVQDLISGLLVFAKKAEAQSGTKQTALLDGLRDALEQRGWNDGSRVPFLALMIHRDLRLYVESHLPQALTPQTGSLSLLECALVCPKELHALCDQTLPLLHMVTLLLEHGANPNEPSSQLGNTIWQQYLTLSYRNLSRKRRLGQMDVQSHLGIMQAMLEHGADVNLRCLYESKVSKTAVMDLLEMVNTLFYHENTEYLEALIRDKRKGQEEEVEDGDEGQNNEQDGTSETWGRSLMFGIKRPLAWLGLPLFSGYGT